MKEILLFDAQLNTSQKVVWLTDIHLNALDKANLKQFFKEVRDLQPSAVFITGDISDGVNTFVYLAHLKEVLKVPIFYVLGNHDFYYGKIDEIRNLTKTLKDVNYLTNSLPISLNKNTQLVGHDGWTDGREGDFHSSNIWLNDYQLIQDFKGLDKESILIKIRSLADDAASSIQSKLDKLSPDTKNVIILTHVPPFKEVCLYDGKPGDEHWHPHFVSKVFGDVVKKHAAAHPQRNYVVLCGHSHNECDTNLLPNLRVIVGDGVVGNPKVAALFRLTT
jgi:predicted MPP superfamily phosphohydrolase